MSDEQIREYAQQKGFRGGTLKRWLDWQEPDKEALLGLAVRMRASENHICDLLEWLEEVSLRDGAVIRDLLSAGPVAKIETDPRLGRADKLKRIKKQIWRWRFPRLSEIEDRLQARIRELKLTSAIRLSVPSGLEGGKLSVAIQASTLAELEASVRELADAAQHKSMAAIFALLNGEATAIDDRLRHQS
jgi:hypothetical protein